jgi:saccharopine dehydrogenase-like NADP-dependent oxidoreductase
MALFRQPTPLFNTYYHTNMSGFKNFAIVGAGNIGQPIAEAFLAGKAAGYADQVVVLTRPVCSSRSICTDGPLTRPQESASSDAATVLTAKGARVVPVDYTDVAALTAALKGIDVVISTLSIGGLRLQVPIAQAAKAAGVRLFAPSEFGFDTEDATSGIFAAKREVAEKTRALGLPTVRFFTGGFSDWLWLPCVIVLFSCGCRVC